LIHFPVTLGNRGGVTLRDIDGDDGGYFSGGLVERQVREDVAELGPLTGFRRSVAEICYALARQLDSGDLSAPAPVARELANRLADLDRSGGKRVSRVDELAQRRATHVSAATPPDRPAGRPNLGS
jgi:hypothetical protein